MTDLIRQECVGACSHSKDESIPRIPAEEHPWYLLATIYGEQEEHRGESSEYYSFDPRLAEKNRVAWNRWVSSALSEARRTQLVDEGFIDAASLVPFEDGERAEFFKDFANRASNPNSLPPDPHTAVVFAKTFFLRTADFSGFVFNKANFNNADFSEATAFFDGALFLGETSFKEAKLGAVSFCGAVFFEDVVFRGAVFTGAVNFIGVKFYDCVTFAGSTMSGVADFSEGFFSKRPNFSETNFACSVSFKGCISKDDAFFKKAVFSMDACLDQFCCYGNIYFDGANFQGIVSFERVNFYGYASFDMIRTLDVACFEAATFVSGASFNGAVFSGEAYFERSSFSGAASFIGVMFVSETSFSGMELRKFVADFRDAKLPESIELHGVTWPPPPKSQFEAQEQIYAYESSRLRWSG